MARDQLAGKRPSGRRAAPKNARGRSSGGSKLGAGRSYTPTIIAVVTLLVLVGVIAFALVSAQSTKSAAQPVNQPITPVNASYQTRVDGTVIVAGSGPTVLDIYEDALCPACKQFESQYGEKVVDGLNTGRLTVRYHMVNLLEQNSSPAGYSTLGGNAMMCAAANGAFPTLHSTLYERQPEEGGAGYTVDDLVTLGKNAGAGPGYEACVRGNTYSGAVAQNYQQAASDPALQQTSGGSRGFGTPTVLVNGTLAGPGTPQLTAALG